MSRTEELLGQLRTARKIDNDLFDEKRRLLSVLDGITRNIHEAIHEIEATMDANRERMERIETILRQ